MNYELLQKHIDGYVNELPVYELKADGSNANAFYVADVVGDKRFAQNFGGYPRSEIAEINDAATLEMQKNLLNQLVDYRSQEKGENVGKSDAEIMLGHRSKYCQTATEQQIWLEDQLKMSYDRNVAMKQALAAKKRASEPTIIPKVESKVDEK